MEMSEDRKVAFRDMAELVRKQVKDSCDMAHTLNEKYEDDPNHKPLALPKVYPNTELGNALDKDKPVE
jgi:hypothetical protein